MKIEQVKVIDLKPADYNPRKMSDKQANDLRNNLKEEGFVVPIVVNKHKGRQNVVIGGHQRLKIAIEEGYKTVPVVYVDRDLKGECKLNLRLNKNTGDWDWEKLMDMDKELLLDVGFDFYGLKIDNQKANDVWEDMPEYQQPEKLSFKDLIVHFKDSIAVDQFSDLIGQKIMENTKYVYYPFKKKEV